MVELIVNAEAIIIILAILWAMIAKREKVL